MELLASGEIGHAARQAAPLAHSGHVFTAARRRFRRPLRTADHASASGELSRSRGPLHLYGLRSRHRARLLPALAAEPLSLRSCARPHVLFSCAAGCCRGSYSERTAEVEIL